MTTELRVWIETTTYERDLADGVQVPGSIYASDRGGTSLRNLLFPAGPTVLPRTFDVEPGRYVVEAMLPNGRYLSDDVDVRSGETSVVRLIANDSPHETHSWQYLVGNVVPREAYFTGGTPIPASTGSQYFGQTELFGRNIAGYLGPPTFSADRRQVTGSPLLTRLAFDTPPSFTAVRALIDLVMPSAQDVATGLGSDAAVQVAHEGLGDEFTQLYRFGLTDEDPFRNDPFRQFLVVETEGRPILATLPAPWPGATGQLTAIEVLVNLTQSPNGSPVAVTVRDPALGAGLAYMATGAFSRAATVFGDVLGMLSGKLVNPLAAAAAGYVLVGNDSGADDQSEVQWASWLDNLKNWFPWMSDGAILWASRRLRTARSEADIELARSGLLEACSRGLPVYTLGLSWLIDGLSQFGDDIDCSTSLDQVRRVAWQVDTEQPFVTVQLGGSA